MSQKNIRRTSKAEQDFAEIVNFISEKSSSTADRFMNAFEETLDFLSNMPEAGASYHSNNPTVQGLRTWRVKGFQKYVIFYRNERNEIVIVRVLHGARDAEGIFDGS